jgi:hypothetical protein
VSWHTSSSTFCHSAILNMWRYDFFCVGVVYSGEYDVRDVTLSAYPHRASLKNMPGHHIFQARPVWIYTQSNITNIMWK